MNRRQIVVLLGIGVAVGVAAALLVPELATRYLPASLGGAAAGVEGTVLDKERAPDRLLVTVETDQGATLITFKKRSSEIDLLVQRGDVVTLSLSRYEPFVEDPEIQRVRKPGRRVATQPQDVSSLPAAAPDSGAHADTAR